MGQTQDQHQPGGPEISDYHFLIIDDQKLIRDLVSRMLLYNGLKHFEVARNGREAYSKIKSGKYNFIITDWGMPGINGIELVRLMRGDADLLGVPVIMLAEEVTKDKIVYAVEEGVNSYLKKPFSEKDLLSHIRKVACSRQNPDPLQRRYQKFLTLKAKQQFSGAIALASQILGKKSIPEVMLGLGECYLSTKAYAKAKAILKKLNTLKTSSRALHLLAKIHMAEQQYVRALDYLGQALDINSLDAGIPIDMGGCYLQMGQTAEAAGIFADIEESDLSDIHVVNIGAAYLDVGDVVKAGEYLHGINSPIPEMVATFNKYAILLRRNGEFKKAIRQYDKCLEIDPGNFALLYNAAVASLENKNPKRALELLNQCLKINPDLPQARALLFRLKPINKPKGHTGSSAAAGAAAVVALAAA